jgi:acyl dehydratase
MVASHEARFSAPIYPGETLAVDLWRKDEYVWFRARVVERDVVAIANGLCQLRRT